MKGGGGEILKVKALIKKKLVRGALALMLTTATIATGPLSSTVEAAGYETFIPFRSYYVPYVTQNASAREDMVQYIWTKLMTEETNYTSGQTYYTRSFGSNWADKYYGDYVDKNGIARSSRGVKATLNPDFDGFLYQTIMSNKEFVIRFINVNNGSVFAEYAKTASKHKYVADALIDLTAGGEYLGGGYNDSNNVFLRGKNKSTIINGAKPNWSATNTSATTHDIDVLRLFGVRYSSLNDRQRAWVKTYMPWMVRDYEQNGASAVASKGNAPALYDLIAVSAEGFNSSKAQEFFNETISRNNLNVGDLIINAAIADNKGNTSWFPSGLNDVRSNTNMSMIFNSDADCDFGYGYGGAAGRGSGAGDNDYDWLAWNIAFREDSSFYPHLRELVLGNDITRKQLEDWIMRYNVQLAQSGGTGAGAIAEWINNANSNKTLPGEYANGFWTGCGKQNPTPVIAGDGSIDHLSDTPFNCPIHRGDSGLESMPKPAGVDKIMASANPVVWGGGVDIYLYDEHNQLVAQGRNELTVPSKYIASNTIKIQYQAHYTDGYNEDRIDQGNCRRDHYGHSTFTFHYADISVCQKNGHNWVTRDFRFYDADGNQIVASDSKTIPHSCEADVYCSTCGEKREHLVDTTAEESDEGNRIKYTFDFSHSSGSVDAKSKYVNKGTGGNTQVFAPTTSTASFLSRSEAPSGDPWNYNGGFGKRNIVTRIYEGEGFNIESSAQGTISLSAGAILPGVKQITVSVTGKDIEIYLRNPKQELDEIKLNFTERRDYTWTFNCDDFTDEELEGAYVQVVLHDHDKKFASGGSGTLGTEHRSESIIKFDSIKVSY